MLEISRVSVAGEEAGERAGELAGDLACENVKKLERNCQNLPKSTKNHQKMKERFDPQQAVSRIPNENHEKTRGNNENPAKYSRKHVQNQRQENTEKHVQNEGNHVAITIESKNAYTSRTKYTKNTA